ncbi:hypothetical protein AVEN_95950-1 [Araneus ventricosus]|uniref:Uncharacterized protein n=1 Tax=Araneus ventricosus TaxID=182803 RepID=A0A4Y2JZK6_ARAVE|nr:hypothetical protein AVEN_95950-1 [Araneus ventricosus]
MLRQCESDSTSGSGYASVCLGGSANTNAWMRNHRISKRVLAPGLGYTNGGVLVGTIAEYWPCSRKREGRRMIMSYFAVDFGAQFSVAATGLHRASFCEKVAIIILYRSFWRFVYSRKNVFEFGA